MYTHTKPKAIQTDYKTCCVKKPCYAQAPNKPSWSPNFVYFSRLYYILFNFTVCYDASKLPKIKIFDSSDDPILQGSTSVVVYSRHYL